MRESSADLAPSATFVSTGNRVQFAEASGVIAVALLSANAREKWEQIADTGEVWNGVAITPESWIPIANSEENWTEVA